MDYTQAIAGIDATEIREAIESKVRDLIAENRKHSSKAKDLEDKVGSILNAMGVEGEDLNSRLLEATERGKQYSQQLAKASQDLETLTLSKAELEKRLLNFENQSKIYTAAQKLGAVPEVLSRLIEDVSNLTLDGDEVFYCNKPLKEFVESDPQWKPFAPALFPQEKKLPTGSSNSTENKIDVVESYISSVYAIPTMQKQI